MQYEPANSIIEKLGGINAIAPVVKVAPQTVLRWRRPKSAGGTGGTIPIWHVSALMAFAKEKGVDLTADEFIPRHNTSSPGGHPPRPDVA